jgi:hypothetical protein
MEATHERTLTQLVEHRACANAVLRREEASLCNHEVDMDADPGG